VVGGTYTVVGGTVISVAATAVEAVVLALVVLPELHAAADKPMTATTTSADARRLNIPAP
jgi:hypothetical protein